MSGRYATPTLFSVMTTDSTVDHFIRDRHWAFDFALCITIAVFTVTPYISRDPETLVLSLALVGPLMFRRMLPRVAVGAATAAAFVMAVTLNQPVVGIVAVPLLVYSIARWQPLRLSRATLGIAIFGSLLGPASWIFAPSGIFVDSIAAYVMTVFACAGIVAAFYLVGRRRNDFADRRAKEAAAEAEQERLKVLEQDQRAKMATVNERNRIARELHDIVAHSLSVIVVQAEGGRALAAKRPERAPEVLGTIAETSREALEEMRRMVGLLRSGGPEQGQESAGYLPTPGLADIADLVRKTSDRAHLTVYGDPPAVSQALGLTAYRIIQESLTNVLKHGGPKAVAQVRVGYMPSAIQLEIADDGRGSAATSDGQGHGLRGMRERVAVHGGRLAAQPRPGGGFQVQASLPLVPETGSIQRSTPSPVPTRSIPR